MSRIGNKPITVPAGVEVKVDGKLWSAYSDREIKVGSTVKVLSINSVKLKVEEWEE